jgi:hypothetical protein
MTDPSMPGEPVGPESDDSQNPTAAAPAEGYRVPPNVQNMLAQLQSMIDNVAVQAGPVLREVAAKAAELAAVAGERAGPLAYKAAETTQKVGQRVAERGKVVAADLRRREAEATEQMPTGMYGGEPAPDSGKTAESDSSELPEN